MIVGLEGIAPHMLGAFMITLACIPLAFVWQDRGRRRADRERRARRSQALAAGARYAGR